MWIWSCLGFVQSSGTQWQWLQVWIDPCVLPPWKGTWGSNLEKKTRPKITRIKANFVFLCLCACISLQNLTRSWSLTQTTSQSCWRKSIRGWCAAVGRRSSGAVCLSSNVGLLYRTTEVHSVTLNLSGLSVSAVSISNDLDGKFSNMNVF